MEIQWTLLNSNYHEGIRNSSICRAIRLMESGNILICLLQGIMNILRVEVGFRVMGSPLYLV